MIKHETFGIEPKTQSFLDAVAAQGGPQIYELSVTDARNALIGAQSSEIAKMPADIEDRTIPGAVNGNISIRIVRPQAYTGTLPVVMYFHGGGWVLGDKTTHDRLIREIANGAEAAVVFVNYTPAPEAQYPHLLEEAYKAVKWIAENGSMLNLDSARMVIAGDSAGGNIAAAVTLMAKERGAPKFAYQILFYPVTDANFETESYRDFSEGIWLTRESMKWFWKHYIPNEEDRVQPTASPLQATTEQLRGLPPTLIITGEFDVLRDEGEAYARKLNEAGVSVTAIRYLGAIHDFMMLNAIAETPAARAAIAQANAMLREVFKK